MVNSGLLDGLSVEEAKVKITKWLTENHRGRAKVNFKLRDWVFSRQRYWESLSRLCIARNAAMFLCRRASCL